MLTKPHDVHFWKWKSALVVSLAKFNPVYPRCSIPLSLFDISNMWIGCYFWCHLVQLNCSTIEQKQGCSAAQGLHVYNHVTAFQVGSGDRKSFTQPPLLPWIKRKKERNCYSQHLRASGTSVRREERRMCVCLQLASHSVTTTKRSVLTRFHNP